MRKCIKGLVRRVEELRGAGGEELKKKVLKEGERGKKVW